MYSVYKSHAQIMQSSVQNNMTSGWEHTDKGPIYNVWSSETKASMVKTEITSGQYLDGHGHAQEWLDLISDRGSTYTAPFEALQSFFFP